VPTIRVSYENYAYLLGVAARLQVEDSKPKTPNDALSWVIDVVKINREKGTKGTHAV
jgi:hypothetical protein